MNGYDVERIMNGVVVCMWISSGVRERMLSKDQGVDFVHGITHLAASGSSLRAEGLPRGLA